MRKAKEQTAAPKKPAAKQTRKTAVKKPATPKKPAAKQTRKAAVKKPAPRKARPRGAPNPGSPAPLKSKGAAKPSISKTQSQVGASKFKSPDNEAPSPKPRPSLPITYGESRLLLLARDPHTLFAAWDMAPSVVKELKARIGGRALAVSTLTLRLTNAGGATRVFHVGRRARSRYLGVDGAPSFIAEIGFTTPTGRFEFIAKSAPCLVPMNLAARHAWLGERRRFVLGYREAGALARRGLLASTLRERTRPKGTPGNFESASSSSSSFSAAAPRVLGGASDLYRR